MRHRWSHSDLIIWPSKSNPISTQRDNLCQLKKFPQCVPETPHSLRIIVNVGEHEVTVTLTCDFGHKKLNSLNRKLAEDVETGLVFELVCMQPWRTAHTSLVSNQQNSESLRILKLYFITKNRLCGSLAQLSVCSRQWCGLKPFQCVYLWLFWFVQTRSVTGAIKAARI